ncbi:MAG: cytochrome c family protein [Rhizobiales bacterium 17-65-6]|nr:MAG: cytochrome c family protein [Rhizobiales bacterium 32-66-11]OYZ96603.1 MAG: cytochrome c family protein [Rhizobiales bacterium 17-65-6]
MRAYIAVLFLLSANVVQAQTGDDVAAGEKAFAKCKACHQVGEAAKNTIGPELNGIAGRPAGTAPGYKYSDALRASGIVWDDAALTQFLHDPKAKISGTKMVFAGLKNDVEIANIIAFLKQYKDAEKK